MSVEGRKWVQRSGPGPSSTKGVRRSRKTYDGTSTRTLYSLNFGQVRKYLAGIGKQAGKPEEFDK
jgi:hypothetical protein